ncbi:MAG: coiled-coil domain-containing protein [Promethearchaeota archaeon]
MIRKYEEKVFNLNSKIEQGNSKILELERRISELTSSKVNLNSELSNFESQVVDFKGKIDELYSLLSEKDFKIEELNKILVEKDRFIEEQKSTIEKIESKLIELQPKEPKYKSEERLICPNCGSVGKDIRVEEDKTKVLGYIGHSPMYGKINVCKKCGSKF